VRLSGSFTMNPNQGHAIFPRQNFFQIQHRDYQTASRWSLRKSHAKLNIVPCKDRIIKASSRFSYLREFLVIVRPNFLFDGYNSMDEHVLSQVRPFTLFIVIYVLHTNITYTDIFINCQSHFYFY